MKKYRIKWMGVFLVSCMLLTGCGIGGKASNDGKRSDSGKPRVIAVMFAAYDFAKQVAGDNIDLTMLMKAGSETHSFEPTPKDIIDIQNSDVFIYTGGESDKWVEGILESVDNSNIRVVKLMDCVETVEEEIVEGMETGHKHETVHGDDTEHSHENGREAADSEDDTGHSHENGREAAVSDDDTEHSHEDGHEAETQDGDTEHRDWDEHVWTSPVNAIKISEKLAEVFAEEDAKNATAYKENLEKYKRELTGLDEEFRKTVNNAERKVVVFGDRFPVRYFTEEYGIEYYAAFPGCTAEAEPSAAAITFLIDKVKTEKLPVVFKIELSNGNVAETIAEATGAEVRTFYACHNVTGADFEAGKTYTDFMRENLESLRKALY